MSTVRAQHLSTSTRLRMICMAGAWLSSVVQSTQSKLHGRDRERKDEHTSNDGVGVNYTERTRRHTKKPSMLFIHVP